MGGVESPTPPRGERLPGAIHDRTAAQNGHHRDTRRRRGWGSGTSTRAGLAPYSESATARTKITSLHLTDLSVERASPTLPPEGWRTAQCHGLAARSAQ